MLCHAIKYYLVSKGWLYILPSSLLKFSSLSTSDMTSSSKRSFSFFCRALLILSSCIRCLSDFCWLCRSRCRSADFNLASNCIHNTSYPIHAYIINFERCSWNKEFLFTGTSRDGILCDARMVLDQRWLSRWGWFQRLSKITYPCT